MPSFMVNQIDRVDTESPSDPYELDGSFQSEVSQVMELAEVLP